MNYSDLAHNITAQLVDQIETGPGGTWSMPWHRVPGLFDVRNAFTDKPYRGVNVIALASTATERDYPTSLFATYRQWSSIDAQVRRGETAAQVIRWVTPKEKDQPDPEGAERLGRRLVPVVFSVFNAAQVDGWTPPQTQAATAVDRNERVDAWIAATGAEISHGHNHAAYRPDLDRIELPATNQFHDTEALYATTLHELCHWTGAQHRLNRDLTGRFGDDAYAAEELVAELGAAIVCAHLDVEVSPRADHAHYLAHWLRILDTDPKALFTAATKAQAALDHLTALQPDTSSERTEAMA